MRRWGKASSGITNKILYQNSITAYKKRENRIERETHTQRPHTPNKYSNRKGGSDQVESTGTYNNITIEDV